MEITEDINDSQYQIRGYQPGEVTINEKTYHTSLILTPNQLITPWPPKTLDELTEAHLKQVLDLNADIILLGTGNKFLLSLKYSQLFDCMDTGAACRTFIALSSEGRNVAAALLIPGKP